MKVGIESVVLPAPVPLPGGVATGLDENVAPDPSRPDVVRENDVAEAPESETVYVALVPCGTAWLVGEMDTVTGDAYARGARSMVKITTKARINDFENLTTKTTLIS